MGETVWSLNAWARAVASMEVGPLPSRVVLVPRLRIAHSLKKELARLQPGALIGTLFVTPVLAAREVLSLAGAWAPSGEEPLRAVRLQRRLEAGVALEHFEPSQLEGSTGWARAFVRTIGELEAAGLRPEQLRTAGAARVRDVARIWDSLEDTGSLTGDLTLARAAELLRARDCWPWPGATLAVVTGHETGAQAAFINAIPRLQLRALGARPMLKAWVRRSHALFPGLDFAPASDPAPKTELEVLKRYLFEDPQVLAAPDRARSAGRDGTVELEEFAGVEAELEATADWLVRQVRAGVPLDGLAVLVPHAEPLVTWVRARLERIPWPGGTVPVFVAGGVAGLSSSGGTRLLALLRALGAWLPAEALAELLPILKTSDGERLAPDDAVQVVAGLGVLGGSAGRPRGALEWFPAARAAHARLEARLAEFAKAREGTDDEEAEARRRWQLENQRTSLARVLPALEALHTIVALLLDEASLPVLWWALRDFLFRGRFLRVPPEATELLAVLGASLDRAAEEPGLAAVRGAGALMLVEETLARLRLTVGRFGEPRVYVGTVRSAVGLGFDAVRIIGLSEGSIPPALREDAVLDSATRASLDVAALGGRALAGHAALQALFRIVVEARRHVSFSFPRADASGSAHEASSVFLEIAAALGRPNALTGAPAAAVPRAGEFARDAFQPAREAQRAARLDLPLTEASWLERVATRRDVVPAHWAAVASTNPSVVHALSTRDRSGLDGYLGDRAASLAMRGLSADEPISASRLKTLLECPHRYLLDSVLHWGEPAGIPPAGRVEALTWGTLVHRVLERFGREHGAGLRRMTKTAALERAEAIARSEFGELMQQYALLSEEVRAAELRRLLKDITLLTALEWAAREEREFIAVERAFGEDEALELQLDGGSLFVHGFIDRLDQVGSTLLVRDFKTGRAHPLQGKEAEPDPLLDVQVVVYGLVARALAKAWQTPRRVEVAYAYVSEHSPLRHFAGEQARALFSVGGEWLGLARALLASRTFPRRPSTDRCGFCAFSVVCDERGPSRSRELLSAPIDELEGRLAAHWGLVEGEEEES